MDHEKNLETISQRFIESFWQLKYQMNRNQSSIEGLNPSEISVLFRIKKAAAAEERGIKVSEISRHLCVTSPTITQLINGLETRGLVERRPDSDDRRVVRIRLTERGEVILKQVSAAVQAYFKGLVEYLGEENSNQLIELLSKVLIYFKEAKENLAGARHHCLHTN